MCTINKSAYKKKVWKLIVCISYIYIYIYIYIYPLFLLTFTCLSFVHNQYIESKICIPVGLKSFTIMVIIFLMIIFKYIKR